MARIQQGTHRANSATKILGRWPEAAVTLFTAAVQIPILPAGVAFHPRPFCSTGAAEPRSDHVRHPHTHGVRVRHLQGCGAGPAVPPEESVEIVDDELLCEE